MFIQSAGYSVHTRPFHSNQINGLTKYLLRLQTEGCCRAVINAVTYRIQPGDLILCKPGDTYNLSIGEDTYNPFPSSDYYMMIAPTEQWITNWWSNYEQITKHSIGFDERLIIIWKQIVYEQRRTKDSHLEILEYLTRVLLLHIERLIMRSENSDVQKQSTGNRIKEFIEHHATEKITLRQVAESVKLSVSRASELFKSTYNQSIMDYAIEVRLTIAKERILFGGATLEDIAYFCGFSSYTHFNRSFRSRFGLSPSQYKQQLHVAAPGSANRI